MCWRSAAEPKGPPKSQAQHHQRGLTKSQAQHHLLRFQIGLTRPIVIKRKTQIFVEPFGLVRFRGLIECVSRRLCRDCVNKRMTSVRFALLRAIKRFHYFGYALSALQLERTFQSNRALQPYSVYVKAARLHPPPAYDTKTLTARY